MPRQPWVDTASARRSTSRQPGREQRRRAIVQAAIAAIEEDGPDALTGRIADRAGLARTHVYRHFASKEELDFAVARHAHRDLTERIRAQLAVDGTPLDIIRAPLAQHVRWAAEHPNLYLFLVGRDYRRGRTEQRVGGSAFAAEISAAARRYLPEFAADPLAADRVVVALLGLVDASVRWWLEHHDATEQALVDRLTTECWLIIDNRLREAGRAVDPRKPLSVG